MHECDELYEMVCLNLKNGLSALFLKVKIHKHSMVQKSSSICPIRYKF